jgi:hypothetical protein
MAVIPSIVAAIVIMMVIIRAIVDPAVIVIISLVGIIIAAVVVWPPILRLATEADAETVCLRIAFTNRQQPCYSQYQEKKTFHFVYFLNNQTIKPTPIFVPHCVPSPKSLRFRPAVAGAVDCFSLLDRLCGSP